MELWDVYDIDRTKSNKTMVRGDRFQKNEYHMVVHVCVFDKDGNMLIQQRDQEKFGWPNRWDITMGGSAHQGETSQQAAERELFEELGIQFSFAGMRPHLMINFEHGFDDIYLIHHDIDILSIKMQPKEVQDVRWASLNEILSMIDNEQFIPYHKSLIQLFFDIRHKYGCFVLE